MMEEIVGDYLLPFAYMPTLRGWFILFLHSVSHETKSLHMLTNFIDDLKIVGHVQEGDNVLRIGIIAYSLVIATMCRQSVRLYRVLPLTLRNNVGFS